MYDNLKKYGRNGDTEIVKTSKNSLWHVNKDEKLLIEKFGKHGEDIVDYVDGIVARARRQWWLVCRM